MFELSEYIGIIAFAISGFFVGIKNRLDMLGILISMYLTAFGGGLIRDTIVHKTPYAFSQNSAPILVFCLFVLLLLLKLYKRKDIENRAWFILSDSIGLVSFSITGALIALEAKYNLMGILSLSFLTAVGGGIARDVIINEVPFIFKTGFYGSVALIVGLFIYLLNLSNLLNSYTLTALFFIGVFLRVIAFYKRWNLWIPR